MRYAGRRDAARRSAGRCKVGWRDAAQCRERRRGAVRGGAGGAERRAGQCGVVRGGAAWGGRGGVGGLETAVVTGGVVDAAVTTGRSAGQMVAPRSTFGLGMRIRRNVSPRITP
ncbi:hypothetical protein Acsp01_21460 [Actinoplanes sp. NBRC 101535]|nr:hypothetical protein Acsp01_21460 [Actinoplanes sp. NBRC 101535]